MNKFQQIDTDKFQLYFPKTDLVTGTPYIWHFRREQKKMNYLLLITAFVLAVNIFMILRQQNSYKTLASVIVSNYYTSDFYTK